MEIKKKPKKRVTFGLVDLYHFDRLQGFTSVPSQGGSTLGMASEHWSQERVSVSEHQNRIKFRRHSALLRFCLEGKLLLSFQQFCKLEAHVKFQQRLLVRSGEAGLQNGNWMNESLKRSLDFGEKSNEDDLGFLDGLEEYYFLQPLSVKHRRIVLRKAGLQRIDPSEKRECDAIRHSRLDCGCSCAEGVCEPSSCECALNGISCQVDRSRFPCVCLSPRHCANPRGCVEFNPLRVRTHYLHTRVRLDAEEAHAKAASALPSSSSTQPAMKRPRLEASRADADGDTELEGGQFSSSFSSSCSSSSSCISRHSANAFAFERSAEEALAATTSSGGCRDCQDDCYMHLLMLQQRSEEAEVDEDEGNISASRAAGQLNNFGEEGGCDAAELQGSEDEDVEYDEEECDESDEEEETEIQIEIPSSNFHPTKEATSNITPCESLDQASTLCHEIPRREAPLRLESITSLFNYSQNGKGPVADYGTTGGEQPDPTAIASSSTYEVVTA